MFVWSSFLFRIANVYEAWIACFGTILEQRLIPTISTGSYEVSKQLVFVLGKAQDLVPILWQSLSYPQ